MKNRIVISASLVLFAVVPVTALSQENDVPAALADEASEALLDEIQAAGMDQEVGAAVGLALTYVENRRSQRYRDVTILVKKIQGMGIKLQNDEIAMGDCALEICQAFKKEVVEGQEGMPRHVLRPLTQNEIAIMAGLQMDSAGMKLYGLTAMMAQKELNRSITSAVAGGLGGPFMGALTDRLRSDRAREGSAAHYNPMTMFLKGGQFAIEAGHTMDDAVDSLLRGQAQAQEEEIARQRLIGSAINAGVEEVENERTLRIEIENINQAQVTDDGREFTMENVILWVSFPDIGSNLVIGDIVKHRVEGIAEQGSAQRQFFVETINSDHRQIPGTDVVEPFKSTTCMGGIMTPREQEQMQEAQVQLAEFEQQLADMPASQRQMMENMMGSQLETVRSMANDGKLCNTQVIEAVFVNPDLKALYSAGPIDGVVMPTTAGEGILVQRIQLDLVILGYEPGNTTGELTTGTVIAISQYQAERDMDVTGEATQELAETITAELMQ